MAAKTFFDLLPLNATTQYLLSVNMSTQDAQKRWELENNVQAVDPDLIYKYEEEKHEATVREKPWAKEYGAGLIL